MGYKIVYQCVKLWKPKTCEKHVKEVIIARDGPKCIKCGRTIEQALREYRNFITVSHWEHRGHLGTKYDPWNQCLGCESCHTFGWEYEKQDWYRRWMVKQYGEPFLDVLAYRARKPCKERDVIQAFMIDFQTWKETGVFPGGPK
jgi:hypothetical protein